MNDVTIGTYSMQTDFGLYLPEYTIPAPAPQTKVVSIIGRDGAVDLTNALGLHYDSRKWTLDFKCFNPTVNWHTLTSNVMNAIHGKRLDFSFADDSSYFWTGRFSVSYYKPSKGEGTIRVEITSDPFKYKKLSSIVQNSVPFGYDKTPYNFRALSSTGITPLGNSEFSTITGGTVAWNQLANKSFFLPNGYTNRGLTLTNDGSGIVSVSGTFDHTAYYDIYTQSGISIVAGHKYFVDVPKLPSNTPANAKNVILGGGGFSYNEHNGSFIITGATTGTAYFVVRITTGVPADTVFTDYKVHAGFFDLTLMFGSTIADYLYTLESGTAGAGIAKLKSWGYFTNDYYAYNAGELMSVNASAHKTVGFNQWDEEWEEGSISTSTGENVANTGRIRSKNYIPVFPNTDYYVSKQTALSANVFYFAFYDAGENFVGTNVNGGYNKVITTPSNAYYMRFWIGSASYPVSTYTSDICINLSKTSGTPKNGDYVAYAANTYALDSSLTLRGIPKLDANNNLYYDGDSYESSGTVTRRYKEITLDGSTHASVTVNSSNGVYYTTFSISLEKGINSTTTDTKIVTSKGYKDYPGVSTGNIYITNAGATLVVCLFDQTLTTKSAVDTYLASNPIDICYELATTIIETATGFTNPQSIDPDGTEQFVDYAYTQGTRDVEIPVGHDTYYSAPITLTNNGGKAVIPTVTASAQMTLMWGNYTYTMQAGTSVIPQLVLESGSTVVQVLGVGTIKFEYTEASL